MGGSRPHSPDFLRKVQVHRSIHQLREQLDNGVFQGDIICIGNHVQQDTEKIPLSPNSTLRINRRKVAFHQLKGKLRITFKASSPRPEASSQRRVIFKSSNRRDGAKLLDYSLWRYDVHY